MTIRRGALLTAALLTLVFQSGCDELAGTDADDLIDALVQAWLPLAEEAAWRYVEDGSYEDESPMETYVYTRTVTGTVVRNGQTWFETSDSNGSSGDLYRVEGGVVWEWPPDMPFAYPIFDLSLAVGASRTVEIFHAEAGDTLRMSGEMTYLRDESVTTPAGTFDCRVFGLEGTFTMASDPDFVMEGGFINWFARGVGIVKNYHTFSGDEEEPAGERTAVLHYYNIPGGLHGGHDGTYAITGRVMQYEGGGVAGVVVNFNDGSEEIPTATTDAEGRYRLEGARSGPYMVGILELPPEYYWEWAPLDIMVIDQDVEVPDFVVVRMNDPGGGFRIQGWARTPEGFAIPEARILLTRYTAFWEVSPAPVGDWEFWYLPEGTYVVKASADYFTFVPDSIVVVVSGSDVEDLVFTGTGGATATGRVVTPLGFGLEGVEMMLGSPFDPSAPQQAATTDSDGYYAFVNVPAGTQTVRGNDDRYMYNHGAYGHDFTVTGTEATIPDIEATPNPVSWNLTISGRMKTSRGQGPWGDDGGGVTAYSTLFGLEMSAAPQCTDGSYTIDGIFDGPFEVRASSVIYPVTPDLLTVTVAGTSVTGQDFTITGFTLSGRAVDDLGNPVSGVTATLSAQGFSDLVVTTGADGRFTFSDLVVYDYHLNFAKEGWSFPLQSFMPLNSNRNVGDVAGTPPPGSWE